ncbi:MAG: hypothetical protein IJZ06_04025 [Bacteroidales bacterium]|nr:hypothetical protein [Bacteroidales bacterium]
MKRYIIILLLLVIPFVGFSQKDFKLVEQSSKNKPNWIYANQMDTYMIQANMAASIEEAQDMVMTSLLDRIASSVAVVVASESTKETDWTVVNDKDSYVENIKASTTLKVAKMPALQGISLSKAEVYWERYMNKKTKESYYDYYILYPFSQFELQDLINTYNAQEKAYNDKIESYKNSLAEKNSVDQILTDINDMKTLMKEFDEADSKYGNIKNIISLYEKTISNIYIDVLENENGKLVIQLKYDEKVMETKSLPKLKSECARDFSKKHNGDKIELTFNTFDCYEQDDNYVEIRFDFGKKRIVEKVNIKL